jgi:hypothetical protein
MGGSYNGLQSRRLVSLFVAVTEDSAWRAAACEKSNIQPARLMPVVEVRAESGFDAAIQPRDLIHRTNRVIALVKNIEWQCG